MIANISVSLLILLTFEKNSEKQKNKNINFHKKGMIDIKLIRENPEIVKESQRKRKLDDKIVDEIRELDEKWRNSLIETDQLKHQKNVVTKEIAEIKKKKGDVKDLIKKMDELNKKLEELDIQAKYFLEKRDALLMKLGNILHEDVPEGKDENDNVEIKRWGTPRKFDFPIKSQDEIIKDLNLADIERGTKISGARFWFLKNDLVKLDLALQRFALDLLIEKGYTPLHPPLMIKYKAMAGTSSMDKFKDQIYKIEKEDLYLIPSSEQAMISSRMDEVIDAKELPIKYVGVSSCFRIEAGTHGKDEKGIFRGHQFNKVEQNIICKPEDSYKYHEELLSNLEEIFQKLNIPYRISLICSGDIGIKDAKQYDLEGWFPGQSKYRELGSCSNVTEWQSRRLNMRYEEKTGGERRYVHTLNATAIATGRAMACILENYQQKDGSIKIPDVLVPYMNGQTEIRKKL